MHNTLLTINFQFLEFDLPLHNSAICDCFKKIDSIAIVCVCLCVCVVGTAVLNGDSKLII